MIGASGATWYVLTVAPQRELGVKIDLLRLGLQAMVPTERRFRRGRGSGNRPVMLTHLHPIMPGYVFVGSESRMNWREVRSVKHTTGYISFAHDGSPAQLSNRDIDIIRRLGERKSPVGGRALRVDDTARLTGGPFRDLEGIVRAIGRDRVTVSIVLFGSARDLAVAVDQVERAD